MNRANLPTNANASSCRCGNALPHTHKREYYTPSRRDSNGNIPAINPRQALPRMAPRRARAARIPAPGRGPPASIPPVDPLPGNGNGGNDNVNACFFPAPAPRRIYCYPAPFSQIGGDPHQPLVLAYGFSKPVQVL